MRPDKLTDDRLTIAITYPFALGTRSGGSTSVFETARELARLGQEVVLLPVSTANWTSFPRPPIAPELLGKERQRVLESEGIEVVCVSPHSITQWLEGRNVARALCKLARRRRVDVVLGFHHEASDLPRVADRFGMRFGMITIWQSYRMALDEGLSRHGAAKGLVKLLNRRIVFRPLRRAEALFATSEFTRGELVDFVGVDPQRVKVCYQGVDPIFATIPRARPSRVERLLFFGRLVPAKGVPDALQALAMLAESGRRSWSYRIMGEGDAQPVLEVARRLGIEDRIEILPFQGITSLCRELEAAHLALMPSHSESFGLSIAEAQAAGLPVVAYRCGSVPEIVEHGVSGWLAPFGDVDRLGHYLELAMDSPEVSYRAGMAGRQRVGDHFTWAKTAKRILQGLRELA